MALQEAATAQAGTIIMEPLPGQPLQELLQEQLPEPLQEQLPEPLQEQPPELLPEQAGQCRGAVRTARE